MELGTLEQRIDQLVTTLGDFNGHRSLWLAADGEIWHTEPEDDLEGIGCVYLCTLMQPSREQLTAAILPAVGIADEARLRVGRWTGAELEVASLAAV